MARPFKIPRQVRNLYKVKLLDTIKIHNIFSLDRLQKAIDNPLLGQINKLIPLIIVNTKQE